MKSDKTRAWLVIEKQMVFEALPWLTVWVEKIQLPNGKIVEQFYNLDMPEFVVVVALTLNGELIVERQYKHGIGKVVMNLPAGYINKNEKPLRAAKRELIEETGYGAGIWKRLGVFTVDGNRGAGKAHIFLAKNVVNLEQPDSGDLEEMEILLLQPSAFTEAILKEEVGGLPSIAAFFLANLCLQEDK